MDDGMSRGDLFTHFAKRVLGWVAKSEGDDI